MPYGPSRCSITAEAPWRLDRLKLGEIEFNDRSQGLFERTVLLVVRQRVQPAGILGLQFHDRGDGIVPPLDPGAAVDGAARANHRCAHRACSAITCPALGASHGLFIDRWTGHGSTPNRYVTLELRSG